MQELCRRAVDAASRAGASYADARYVAQREQRIETKNGTVAGLTSATSRGVGIRVIAGGAWGFAATSRLDPASIAEAAELAVRIARASATTLKAPVALSPLTAARAQVPHTARQNPFDIPLEKRVQLLLDCDRLMAEAADVRLRQGSLATFHEEKLFVSTEGAEIFQERIETGAGIEATATDGSETQRRSYPASHGGQMATQGWELVEELNLPGEAPRVAHEAQALLTAPHFPAGNFDIILDGSQLALQLHESCGHPIELDRVLGTEASFAGTSFLTTDKLGGGFRYGSDAVNITADATLPGGLGSFDYDDEGVPAQCTQIVDKGVFRGYLTSRETAPSIGQVSQGAMRADGWARLPLIRMTNINLLPGDWTLDEMIRDTDHGFLLCTNTSWSIDDKRLNFQFGTEAAFEITKGELGQMYRNPTYQGITPRFWGSCDAVSGKAPGEWVVWGVPNCGKGEPMQTARVGHGVAPARFRQVRCGVMQDDAGEGGHSHD
jgi:TldD protein